MSPGLQMPPETTQEACICFLFLQLQPSCRRVCTAGASASQQAPVGEAHKPLGHLGLIRNQVGSLISSLRMGCCRKEGWCLLSLLAQTRTGSPSPTTATKAGQVPHPPGVVGEGRRGPLSRRDPDTRVEGLPAGKGAIQEVLLRAEPSQPAWTRGSHAGTERV